MSTNKRSRLPNDVPSDNTWVHIKYYVLHGPSYELCVGAWRDCIETEVLLPLRAGGGGCRDARSTDNTRRRPAPAARTDVVAVAGNMLYVRHFHRLHSAIVLPGHYRCYYNIVITVIVIDRQAGRPRRAPFDCRVRFARWFRGRYCARAIADITFDARACPPIDVLTARDVYRTTRVIS